MLAEAKTGEFLVECVDTLAAGIERLATSGIDAVLLDLTLPDSVGLETFTRLHAAVPDLPTVIYTSVDDEEVSLYALSHGAADYLVKSEVNSNWLARYLIYAIQRSKPTEPKETIEKPDAHAIDSTLEIERSSESETKWMATFGERRVVSIPVLEKMKTRLLALVRQSDCEEIYIDMSRVEYIANAAISMLLIVHKRCVAAKKRLVLGELKPQVREQLSSRRFDKVFELE